MRTSERPIDLPTIKSDVIGDRQLAYGAVFMILYWGSCSGEPRLNNSRQAGQEPDLLKAGSWLLTSDFLLYFTSPPRPPAGAAAAGAAGRNFGSRILEISSRAASRCALVSGSAALERAAAIELLRLCNSARYSGFSSTEGPPRPPRPPAPPPPRPAGAAVPPV